MLTIWVDKSSLKMPKIVHFAQFLKIWSLRSNSVTRQVNFSMTKIGGKRQNSKNQMRHFEKFSNNVICCPRIFASSSLDIYTRLLSKLCFQGRHADPFSFKTQTWTIECLEKFSLCNVVMLYLFFRIPFNLIEVKNMKFNMQLSCLKTNWPNSCLIWSPSWIMGITKTIMLKVQDLPVQATVRKKVAKVRPKLQENPQILKRKKTKNP